MIDKYILDIVKYNQENEEVDRDINVHFANNSTRDIMKEVIYNEKGIIAYSCDFFDNYNPPR